VPPPPRTAGPKKTGELSKTTATGVAIMKGESDPPLRPDAEYPAWLWGLAEPQPTVPELTKRYDAPGGLTLEQMRRLWRYSNKQRIKTANQGRAKQ